MRIRTGLVAITMVGAALLATMQSSHDAHAAITTSQRTYAAGKYGLELGGNMAGWVLSVEGGGAVGEVVTEAVGPDLTAKKHIANIKFEDLKTEVGTEMSRPFYQWIKDTTDGKHPRMDGSVLTANYDFAVTSELTFSQALITEVDFPALDAASKEAAKMTVKFSPQQTRFKQGAGGKVASSSAKIDANALKRWAPSNFRITIDGVDCTRVSKVESVSIKQKVAQDQIGVFREPSKLPTAFEYSNIVVTLPESSARSWYDWHQSFIIDGKRDQANEKTGKIEFLSPNMQEVLFTLDLKQVGIFRLTPDKGEPGDAIRRVKAEMYVERIDFSFSQLFQ
jgi:hypothetical protein